MPERRGRVQSRHSRRRRSRVTTTEQVLTGFSDLEILTKYAFFASDKHETRLARGNRYVFAGRQSHRGLYDTHVGPIFMFAKGFGDIPNQGLAKYLRPFAIQGDAEYLWRTGGTQADDVAVDWDISYSLQYLNDYVRNLNLQPQVRNLIPFAEFTYEQVVRTRYAGTPPDLAVLPGVAYMTDTWQVSVATALALNHATVAFDHAAVITMLSITLDKIFPAAGRTLF